jgi:hypothetical protein
MFSLEELFCCVDEFCSSFEPHWQQQLLQSGLQHRRRERSLCLSEIMTIGIGFHQSCYRKFKTYYLEKVQASVDFGISRLGQQESDLSSGLPLHCCRCVLTCVPARGGCTGVSFLDSTSLKVCHNRRIQQHKVFENLAARGKTSIDWFRSFKLHLVVNDKGELQGLHPNSRQYR